MFEPLTDAGAPMIDAIIEAERAARRAHAVQFEQIAALFSHRQEQPAGFRGDAALSVIGELSLARHISPGAAGTQFAVALTVQKLPGVLAALREGMISEPTVRAICREVDPLAIDDFPLFDGELAPHLDGLTPRRAAELARSIVISLDAEAADQRAERARADQRVEIHGEPDGVATLIVTGPAEQIVAAHRSLESWAFGLRATGDQRTVGQIMVATLTERLTGVVHADGLSVEIGIVIDAATLLGTADDPVELVGHGPITDPVDGALIARDPRRRFYDGPLADHIRTRDRHRCRQPGCDCRIRDIDHVIAHAAGGPTTAANAQGLCRRSHTIKHLPGWHVTTAIDGTITWTTPTGHSYTSPTPGYARAG